jgi:hypothetical protein
MSALMDIAELRARGSDEGRVRVGGRPGSATLTLGYDWAELPTATELAALLPRVPVAAVRLAEPVDLSVLPAHVIVRIIALLRECSSVGAQVTWSLTLGAEQLDLIPHLDHLPAPDRITVAEQGTPSVEEWRSSGNFGLLYFRRGSTFLSVVDQRPESSGEFIVDDPTVIEAFFHCLEGRAWADVIRHPGRAAAARDLVSRGLIMRVGDHCVTLPVHMRSWPLGAALLGGTLASAGKKRDDAAE